MSRLSAKGYARCFDVDKLSILCAQYDRRIDELGEENAKLRELVIALQHCRDGRCDGECSMFTPADNNRGVPSVCEAYGVMRELGIEVK